MTGSMICHSLQEFFFQLFTGVLHQNNLSQKYSAQQIYEKKVVLELAICHQKWAPRDFPRASPSGNPSEQPCQPLENPVHPSSFTRINPDWPTFSCAGGPVKNFLYIAAI